jgi:hypothetical protein
VCKLTIDLAFSASTLPRLSLYSASDLFAFRTVSIASDLHLLGTACG